MIFDGKLTPTRRLVLGAIAGLLGTAGSALAQPAHEGPPPVKPAAMQAVVFAATDALGGVRGPQRELRSINTIQYRGEGMIADGGKTVPFTKYVAGVSYAVPAMREDFTLASGRRIQVVNGVTAWNEKTPGVGDAASKDGAVRNARLWATPFGVVRAAVDAEAKDITIAKSGDNTLLTVKHDALTLTATLNAKNLPVHVRVAGAGPVREFDYIDYKGDWDGYDIFFPARIVEKVGGKTVLDLKVTEFRNNPYVVFPIPAARRGSK